MFCFNYGFQEAFECFVLAFTVQKCSQHFPIPVKEKYANPLKAKNASPIKSFS